MIVVLSVVLSVLCGVFWRIGGADQKLWRRIGSSACIVAVILLSFQNIFVIPASAFVFWGCNSYFGWINNIVVRFCEWVEVEREYWWNFFAENLAIQCSVLFVKPTVATLLWAVVFAFVSAAGKVLIDGDSDGWCCIGDFMVREDVASEFWHGFSNCLFVGCNLVI